MCNKHSIDVNVDFFDGFLAMVVRSGAIKSSYVVLYFVPDEINNSSIKLEFPKCINLILIILYGLKVNMNKVNTSYLSYLNNSLSGHFSDISTFKQNYFTFLMLYDYRKISILSLNKDKIILNYIFTWCICT